VPVVGLVSVLPRALAPVAVACSDRSLNSLVCPWLAWFRCFPSPSDSSLNSLLCLWLAWFRCFGGVAPGSRRPRLSSRRVQAAQNELQDAPGGPDSAPGRSRRNSVMTRGERSKSGEYNDTNTAYTYMIGEDPEALTQIESRSHFG